MVAQIIPIQGGLAGKQQIVHFPKLALLAGGKRCLMGKLRIAVDDEREVSESDLGPHTIDALGLQLVEGPGEACAIGALKIGVEADLHLIGCRRRGGRCLVTCGDLHQTRGENQNTSNHHLCSELLLL